MRIPRIYNFNIRLEKASNSKCRVVSKSPKVNSPRGGGRLIDVLEKESLSLIGPTTPKMEESDVAHCTQTILAWYWIYLFWGWSHNMEMWEDSQQTYSLTEIMKLQLATVSILLHLTIWAARCTRRCKSDLISNTISARESLVLCLVVSSPPSGLVNSTNCRDLGGRTCQNFAL